MRMFNLITQKQKAISNAIDGKVRFAGTAKVLSAGGDYLAIAKAINADEKEPLEFEYEKIAPAQEGEPAPQPQIVVVQVKDNGLWDSMYKELKAKKEEMSKNKHSGQRRENQLSFF